MPDKLGEVLHPTATPRYTSSAHRDPRRSLKNNMVNRTWLSEVVTDKWKISVDMHRDDVHANLGRNVVLLSSC